MYLLATSFVSSPLELVVLALLLPESIQQKAKHERVLRAVAEPATTIIE